MPDPQRVMVARAANQFLDHLPDAALSRLRPHLEPISLRRGDVLFRAHEPLAAVYFPETAVVSLISMLATGQSLEVGLVGRDGFAGASICAATSTMICDGVAQIAGEAQRIDADVLRQELAEDDALQATFFRFAELSLARSMQLSLCNTFHSVEQRCIRWLLTVSDLVEPRDIALTHDLLATMLGVRRPTVTTVVRTLAAAHLVGETRGHIVLRDLRGLEDGCCECYDVLRREQRRLLGY